MPVPPLPAPPPHRAKAYLLLVLDVTRTPPVGVYVRIYSEEVPTLLAGHRTVELYRTEGADYDDAQRKLRTAVETDPYLAWVRPLMRWSPAIPSGGVGTVR